MCPSHVTLLRQAAVPLEIRYNPEKILSEFNFGFQVLHNPLNVSPGMFQDSEGAYYWHITSGTIQRHPPEPEDGQVSLGQNTAGAAIYLDTGPSIKPHQRCPLLQDL